MAAKKIIPQEIIEEIIRLHKSGLSCTKIDQLIGIDRHKISKILKENGYVEYNKISHPYDNLFSEIITEEDAYWLGMLYADGNIEKVKNRIRLGLVDKEHIEKFKKYTGVNNTILEEKPKNENQNIFYMFKFSSEKVKNNLFKLGCVPKKSLILECPNENQVPQHLFRHFVRGYCDGDGSVLWNNTPVLHFIGTENFLKGIQKRMNWIPKEIKVKGNVFYLQYHGREKAFNYMKNLYENSTVYLNRKYNKFLEIKRIMEKKEG